MELKHADTITKLARMDEDRAISASYDKQLLLWSLSTRTCVYAWKPEHQQAIFALLPAEQNTFVTGSHDHTIKLWKCNQKKSVWTANHLNKECIALQLQSPKQLLIAGFYDGYILSINLSDGTKISQYKAHNASINDIAWISQSVMATASSDRLLKFLQTNQGMPTQLHYTHSSSINKVLVVAG